MSKTFSSNPSRISRGRGGVGGGVTVNNFMTRGRGVSQRSQVGQIDQKSNFNSSRARGTVIARGKMNPQAPGQGNEAQEQQQDGSEGRGQHAGGYTVFSPNEKRRQKVNQMALRETEAYERYKQANTAKRFNYVGTTGGGEISEEQVRARQAQKVRAAKFNRQMKQEEQRQKTKKAEEDAIQAKRDEARRKAELNAQRQARAPPAGEIRRNRESFLAQFENRNVGKAAETPPQAPTSRQSPSSYQSNHQPGKCHGNNNNNSYKSNNMGKVQSGNVRTGAQVFQTTETPSTASYHSAMAVNKTGLSPRQDLNVKTEFKQEWVQEDDHASGGFSHMDEELDILSSMYPDNTVEELTDLLQQMGSLDGVIAVMESSY